MGKEESLTEEPEAADRILGLGIDRRQFMVRAAALGLIPAAFTAFLAACIQQDAEEAPPLATAPDRPFPTPTPFTAAAVSPAPTAPPPPAAASPAATPIAPPLPATASPAATPPAAPPPATPTPFTAAAVSPAPTAPPLPATASPTATSTAPPLPATASPSATPTAPPLPATASPTATPMAAPQTATASPTATPTPVPPSATPTSTPAPLLASERARISHLVWRAGFGASPPELERFRAMGLQKTIDHLVDFETVDDSALERRLDSQELDLEGMSYLQRWWLQRMAYSARPLQEKMTLFWHGILTRLV